MSRGLDTARKALRLWSAGDLDAALDTMRPDVEWHLALALPDLPPGKRIYRGRDEVRKVWETLRSVWQDIRVTIEEVLVDDKRTVVARTRFRGRGGTSGIEVDRMIFYVWELDEDDRLLARSRTFESEEEARRAARVGQ